MIIISSPQKKYLYFPSPKSKSQCQINFFSSSLPVKWPVAAVCCCTHHFVPIYLVAVLVSWKGGRGKTKKKKNKLNIE
jgi:hypothetical protein